MLLQVLERPAREPDLPGGRLSGHGGAGESRITADAVLASPDALPIRDILRGMRAGGVGAAAAAAARPGPAGAGRGRARAGPAAEHAGPRAVPGDRAPRAPDDRASIRGSTRSAAPALDDETAALARALYAWRDRTRGPRNPAQLDYEITRLLLELEDDQLSDRSDYNEAAQAEAERAGDREEIDRLMLERQQINEARRSLDRRREQTRLLASHRR